jgi:hypothetical protein
MAPHATFVDATKRTISTVQIAGGVVRVVSRCHLLAIWQKRRLRVPAERVYSLTGSGPSGISMNTRPCSITIG